MHFQAMKLLLFSLLLFLLQSPVTAEDPVITVCGSSNYTSGSQYETNLNSLLSSLSSNGLLKRESFYNATFGDEPNRVYGFSQCMSRASEEVCRQCLINSTVESVQRCPNRTGASIRYYNCILRYSDEFFFSKPDSTIRLAAWPVANVTNPTAFNTLLGGLMDSLSSSAASAPSKYATNVSIYMDFDRLYGLSQCTRDLLEKDCRDCLRTMITYIPICCNGKKGGNVYSVSCNIRYETYSFFDESPFPPPPAAASPTPTVDSPTTTLTEDSGTKNTSRTIIIIITSVVVALILISTICTLLLLRRKSKTRKSEIKNEEDEMEITNVESLLFNLSTIRAATYDFSPTNKLGEGGFGPVYKGALLDGREIAVKRLSKTSTQGLVELRNEVALVAKLQHKNLVRLWGWCIEEQEKMLIYEYVPNTSLDKFLFDPVKRVHLNWERRYKIIAGIARGLLYLHEDSRLRIIHRDLKASNILLDEDMNPKIADFGLAKLFSVDQTRGDTSRIAGTYGYMAPEYAFHGQFSTKSDVFSFGVLVLEIVMGRKILLHEAEHTTNLLSYAWRHWHEGTYVQIIDQNLAEQHLRDEILRCIHMGLLCVQEDANKRPTMSFVVLMLSSYSMTLPVPSLPEFSISQSSME